MSDPAGAQGARSMVLRVSVPASGSFRSVATELATKVAEYLGSSEPDAESAGAVLDKLASHVAPEDAEQKASDITFEFMRADGDLVIEARCDGRSSQARHPLPV
jgi:type II secretory ATPase GspE/PulE/Tfp pilus assembly ATPase PilB-like protein